VARINPALVLALQNRVSGNELAIFEDAHLSRVALHLDDPPLCRVRNTVLIAADSM
jgi:hypothetical protein